MLLGLSSRSLVRVQLALRHQCAFLNPVKRVTALEKSRCSPSSTLTTSSFSDNVTAVKVVAMTGDATELLAHYFASTLHPGDCYLLIGEVGAGKSHFSRAFIRAALKDDCVDVPSPTYVLENRYSLGPHQPRCDIHHYDLYRIEKSMDLDRLELDKSFQSGISLVEWADRLPIESRPPERLELRFSVSIDQNNKPDSKPVVKEEEEEEEEEDTRWREIDLIGVGHAWSERVQKLTHHIHARGGDLGLAIVER